MVLIFTPGLISRYFVSIEDGIVICVNDEHPEKAEYPIVIKEIIYIKYLFYKYIITIKNSKNIFVFKDISQYIFEGFYKLFYITFQKLFKTFSELIFNMSTVKTAAKPKPKAETKKAPSKLEEQTFQLNRLRSLNEQLKQLLKEKYPDPEDQEYLGINTS